MPAVSKMTAEQAAEFKILVKNRSKVVHQITSATDRLAILGKNPDKNNKRMSDIRYLVRRLDFLMDELNKANIAFRFCIGQ